jgi:hypothetical protein
MRKKTLHTLTLPSPQRGEGKREERLFIPSPYLSPERRGKEGREALHASPYPLPRGEGEKEERLSHPPLTSPQRGEGKEEEKLFTLTLPSPPRRGRGKGGRKALHRAPAGRRMSSAIICM